MCYMQDRLRFFCYLQDGPVYNPSCYTQDVPDKMQDVGIGVWE